MKKILSIAVLLILIGIAYLFLGGFFGTNFEHGYSRLVSIESEYGVSEEQLTPAGENMLDGLESELKLLENSLGDSRDGKALKLLIGSRLDLIKMGKNFLQAEETISTINQLSPECSRGGVIAQVKDLYDQATAKATLALEKRRIFLNNYPEQAQKAGMTSNEDFKYAIRGLSESAESAKAILDSYCP